MDNAYAMVVERYGEPLVRRNFPLPVPRDGEVRIRILATGICGSDVHVWRGQDERSHLPMILGHEGIGYVDAVRPGRLDLFGRELREGDLVVWNRGVSCKACYECLIKRRTYTCKHRWSYGFSKSILDYPYLNGSYASHMLLVPQTEILRLLPREEVDPRADYVPYVSACCAGTTTACAFEQTRVESGDTVIIQGPGPLGLYGVLFAREAGAGKIIVIGGTQSRLELCRQAGATHIINRNESTPQERAEHIASLTDGRGGDAVFEFSGTAEAVAEGLPYTAVNGTYTSAGIAVDVGEVPINWFRSVARKNVTVRGVWVGDAKNTWQAVQVFSRHRDVLDQMITRRFPLEQATEALEVMERKQAMKVALLP